ncbi:hypothetical protein PF010_g15472 [Phytophthora fragariae]|uniref:Uncharacterized protein n=1 Tax=Phytophthora fragariae TaxID=53985 RepID=A0A6A3EMU9_9STRA|nr:hypothetical protein PF009_g17295 [Phytophthora fragariae]KAE8998577.1 hypothetical protein PF011_g14999 [Phytophthora fragariae]KAE9098694.1 hypothetical protein PF010_g15472 [Phytophthora fragariae]KAE9215335.1 hypothetical protein PF002_g17405 [Phytophthora fragariae]
MYVRNMKKLSGGLPSLMLELNSQVQRKCPSPLDVNVVASLRAGLLCVNSVSTYRRYDEGDRVILVGTTKWFLSTGEIVLQDSNWTVISSLPEDPLHSCVMKSVYSADPDRGAIAPPVDESENELDDEPELLWAEVESELLWAEVESELLCAEVESELDRTSELELLADAADSELDEEVLDVDAEALVLVDEAVEEAALALDEVMADEEEEVVVVAVAVEFAAETPETAKAMTIITWINFISTGELHNERVEFD